MLNNYIIRVEEEAYDIYLDRPCLKLETYRTTLKLAVGMKYKIRLKSGIYKKIRIIDIITYPIKISNLKEIVAATPIENGLKQMYFNEEKGTSVALWEDGTKTKIKCQPGDTFDKEKAVALCYMKKYFGNNGSYNEILKKWVK